jgi:hypothetical protein
LRGTKKQTGVALSSRSGSAAHAPENWTRKKKKNGKRRELRAFVFALSCSFCHARTDFVLGIIEKEKEKHGRHGYVPAYCFSCRLWFRERGGEGI